MSTVIKDLREVAKLLRSDFPIRADVCDRAADHIGELNKRLMKQIKKSGECACDGWGCKRCCSSEEEIRSRQGTFG